MRAMKLHRKPEWIKRQVFRKPVRPTGCWVKSKTEPMLYSAYAFYINRLGRNTGFEDELTSYCFRLELHFVRRRVRLFSPNTSHDLSTRRTCTVPQSLRRRKCLSAAHPSLLQSILLSYSPYFSCSPSFSLAVHPIFCSCEELLHPLTLVGLRLPRPFRSVLK
jgi:hypothetical protein